MTTARFIPAVRLELLEPCGDEVGVDEVRAGRLRNLLEEYAEAAAHTRCFLNSGPLPELVFLQNNGTRTILNPTVYAQLVKEANP